MKKFSITRLVVIFSTTFIMSASSAQSNKDKDLIEDSKTGKMEFIKTDKLMKNLFDDAYGYVIFPNIGKGGIAVGGATGNGIVYEKRTLIGKAKITQLNFGFQFGGQAYREVIFFESKETLDNFKENKIELSAQASAVAATSGASANVKFRDGILIFTQEKGGLMYEASIGGQKFKFTAF